MSQTENRPWGKFDILLEETYCKVKKITVIPGKRLSYQRHKYREEYWRVVKGVATVTIDDKVNEYREGESVFIAKGAAHRLANMEDSELVIIEIQRGSYFGEDDIIRLEDDFGRV